MGCTDGQWRADAGGSRGVLRQSRVVRAQPLNLVSKLFWWTEKLMVRSAFLLALLLQDLAAFAAQPLQIDPSHSAVVFSWNHRGLSHPLARLEKVSGTVFLDASDLAKSRVQVTLPLDGLRTGDDFLDKRLKGAEFF